MSVSGSHVLYDSKCMTFSECYIKRQSWRGEEQMSGCHGEVWGPGVTIQGSRKEPYHDETVLYLDGHGHTNLHM